MLKKLISSVTVFIFIAVLGSISPALSQEIVVPNIFTNMADFPQPYIFSCDNNGPDGLRTQVLYPADQLEKGTITAIVLRLFPGSIGITPTEVPNLTINLSHTEVEEGNLSPTFADNVGPDETTVFSGSFPVPEVPACNTNPCPFPPNAGLLQVPFDYDPADGNLLLEIVLPPCVGGVSPLVEFDSTDDLQSVGVFDFDSPTGFVLQLASIAEIVYAETPTNVNVPTLSEWGLIAMAIILGGVSYMVLRKRKAVA